MSWAAVASAAIGTVGGKLLSGGGGNQASQNQSSSSNSTSNSTSDSSGTNTQTPNLPPWLQALFDKAGGNINANGANTDQQGAADWLRNNMGNGGLTAAGAAANGATADAFAGINKAGSGISTASQFLNNQLNNGSYTLGAYFKDPLAATGGSSGYAAASGAPLVNAGTGAGYMGAYQTPLNNDYVNASLADYDNNAAVGFNGLRAASAPAFANKRTGVAEGTYQSNSDRNRSLLDSSLRLNAFNTAAGYGQTDASRALSADTTNATLAQSNNQFNAGNLLNNNQFNANLGQNNSQFNTNLTNNRQQFDLNQAQVGDQSRQNTAINLANVNATGANVAGQGAAIGAQGLNNNINLNNAGVANANAVGNINNMTWQQLMSLINAGGVGVGQTTSLTSNTNTNGSSASNGTGTGTSSQPYDYAGNFGNMLLAAGYLNRNKTPATP